MKSFFSDVQWQWVAERYREGYPIGDLALFLGIHRNSVRRGLIRMGAMPEARRELPSLRPRRAEFLRLTRMRGAGRFDCGDAVSCGQDPAARGAADAVRSQKNFRT